MSPLDPPKDSKLGTIIFVILLLAFIFFVPMIAGISTPWFG